MYRLRLGFLLVVFVLDRDSMVLRIAPGLLLPDTLSNTKPANPMSSRCFLRFRVKGSTPRGVGDELPQHDLKTTCNAKQENISLRTSHPTDVDFLRLGRALQGHSGLGHPGVG